MRSLQLKKLVWGWLLIFWSAAAAAAQATFAHDIASVAPADVALSIVLAIVGGAAYSANKVADPSVVLKSVAAEIIKDSLTSIVVGLLFFFVGCRLGWDSMTKAGVITLAGYGGSRVLEPGVSAFIKWIGRLGDKAQ